MPLRQYFSSFCFLYALSTTKLFQLIKNSIRSKRQGSSLGNFVSRSKHLFKWSKSVEINARMTNSLTNFQSNTSNGLSFHLSQFNCFALETCTWYFTFYRIRYIFASKSQLFLLLFVIELVMLVPGSRVKDFILIKYFISKSYQRFTFLDLDPTWPFLIYRNVWSFILISQFYQIPFL